MRVIELPGQPVMVLRDLVLDLNGTLTNRGALIPGVAERLALLKSDLKFSLLTADTLGMAEAAAGELGVAVTRVTDGAEKAAIVERLGADGVVAIGNGRNDVAMLQAARLGIAVIGPEGAAAGTLVAADVICRSITDALDLLVDERLLIATLRQ